MKQSMAAGLLLLGLCTAAASTMQRPETLPEMKTRADSVPIEERVRVCAGIARRSVEEARDRYARDASNEGKLLLEDSGKYAEMATDAAIQTRKHEKQLEIDLRDISHRLEALKRTLSPDDQPSADSAISHFEKLRKRLLDSMFGKGKR